MKAEEMISLIGSRDGQSPRIKAIPFGFTLAELLISVVILSFGLVAIIGSHLTAVNTLNTSQNRITAVEFLQNKLGLLKQEALEQNGLLPADYNEKTILNNRPATYRAEISSLPVLAGLDLSEELALVKLSLAWKERDINKDAALFIYLEKKH
jgi:prepilin-type N-terminal cleavage/methylation domain-containing protein